PTPGSGRVHSTELNDQYVVLLENVPEQVVYHWLASGGGGNPARRSAATECLPPGGVRFWHCGSRKQTVAFPPRGGLLARGDQEDDLHFSPKPSQTAAGWSEKASIDTHYRGFKLQQGKSSFASCGEAIRPVGRWSVPGCARARRGTRQTARRRTVYMKRRSF